MAILDHPEQSVIGASLSEPHLGPYSGCGLCHIMVVVYNKSYVLPNAHARSLCGQHSQVQRSVEAESAGQRGQA